MYTPKGVIGRRSYLVQLIAKTQMLPTVEPHLFFDAAGFQSIQAHCCQVISICLNATCEISLAELWNIECVWVELTERFWCFAEVEKKQTDVIGIGAFATKWRLFVNSTFKDEGIFTSLNISVMDKHQDESLDPLYLHYASN